MSTAGFSPLEWNTGLDNQIALIETLWQEKPRITVSEYAESRRVLPTNTPFPGPWRNAKTPYLVEPMDNMSAHSPVQRTIIAKGAQLGFTAAAENCVVYWMDVNPAEILFISATEGLLTKWVTKRLEPAIDSCGVRQKIFSQMADKRSRRTGDKVFTKEFVGGTLDMASAQAASSLRSDSKRILIRDEIDGAPAQLRTGEGNWLKVSYVRTVAYNQRKKILDFSTPTTFADSAIWPEYESGDQRKFFVPCPFCGHFQVLEWAGDDKSTGMKWELKNGRVDKVWYSCASCHGEIRNFHKGEFLGKGEWRPTSQSYSDTVRSYHLSSIYSPVGMLSWEDMVTEFLAASSEQDGMRAFTNLYLGLPYRETGARPKLENVIELRGQYKSLVVPPGVLFLTAAVDVQRGSEKDTANPARLEMEVCGHGAGYRTWSIEYRVFVGDTSDPLSGAWADLVEYWKKTQMSYLRQDGKKFSIKMVLVDSGDGPNVGVVYRFVAPWAGVFPSKGFGYLKRKKGETADEVTSSNFRRYRVANIGADKPLYEISTNYYKNIIYENLKRRRPETGGPTPPGFCDFPLDYGERYFEMLTAAEHRRDGSFDSGQRRDEALDCRVYNLCAADAYLAGVVLQLQADAKGRGYRPEQIQSINSRAALELLAKSIGE